MTGHAFLEELARLGDATPASCDVLIVGCGPAGIAAAYGLEGANLSTIILESGTESETAEAEALNAVHVEDRFWSDAQTARRNTYHAPQASLWRHDHQGFGVRCRAIGGSTAAWAGKSAAFDEIDFEARTWVPNSGWPIARRDLDAHLDRAAARLNLSVNCYDDQLWEIMGRRPPQPIPDSAHLRSFFWQFSRSTLEPMDVMRLGAELMHRPPEGCRVIAGATALRVTTNDDETKATGVIVADATGHQRQINAHTVILAASAIENARLLLNSGKSGKGLGNRNDTVGRYLMDHPGAVVGRFAGKDIIRMSRLYGFFGLKVDNRISMYMRGLAPTPEMQKRQGLLNCAAYMPGERAPNDPWDAAKRILKRQSKSYVSDALAILGSPALVAKGLGRIALQHRYMPGAVSRFVVNQVVRFRPGFAAEEFLTQGIPHKLIGLPIEAICEQAPDPENRITLSDRKDRFGLPLPKARWRVGDMERRTLAGFAHLMRQEFERAQMPVPVLEDWVADDRLDDVAIIDMAHSAGTTRMSADPRTGTVDANCKLHGTDGLYLAGASVFPTSGHANPTLMIVALADRLAAHIRSQHRR